jgi:hypothetical protein
MNVTALILLKSKEGGAKRAKTHAYCSARPLLYIICARGGAALSGWWSAGRRVLQLRDLVRVLRVGLREEGGLLPLDESGAATGERGLGAGPNHVEPARELAHGPAVEREGAREGRLVDGGVCGVVDCALE